MALSLFALADVAVEGGFHVPIISVRSIGVEIPPGREKQLIDWMAPDAKFTRRRGGCFYFKPIDRGDPLMVKQPAPRP